MGDMVHYNDPITEKVLKAQLEQKKRKKIEEGRRNRYLKGLKKKKNTSFNRDPKLKEE